MQIFNSKFFILGILVLIIASIPLTIFFIREQQTIQSGAQAATTLSFEPSAITDAQVGEDVSLDIRVDPGNVNIVSIIRLQINYDPAVLELTEIVPAPPFSVELEKLTSSNGTAAVAYGIGADVTQAVQSPAVIAKVTFKALQATEQPTVVTFDSSSTDSTQVLSLSSGDSPGENVLATTNPASISINEGSSTEPTPTIPDDPTNPTPTQPVGGNDPSPTPQPTEAPNQAPVCTILGADRELSGTAPYSIAFTATGSDPDGTITKVSFNFGDGPVEDVTSEGGIGTNAVSIQKSHTYNNPGTYQVSATLTDNDNALSTPATCSSTVTITEAQTNNNSGGNNGSDGNNGGGGNTGGDGGGQTTPQPTIQDPGSLATTLGIMGGIFIILIGGVLIFIL